MMTNITQGRIDSITEMFDGMRKAPSNTDIFCMIAATVDCYNEDKMTMDEALKIIVDVAKDVV